MTKCKLAFLTLDESYVCDEVYCCVECDKVENCEERCTGIDDVENCKEAFSEDDLHTYYLVEVDVYPDGNVHHHLSTVKREAKPIDYHAECFDRDVRSDYVASYKYFNTKEEAWGYISELANER